MNTNSPSSRAGHRVLREGHREAFETARAYVEQCNINANNLTAEHLNYLYHTLRLPADAIGQLIDRSDGAVRLRMRELGIVRRSVGEARTGRYNVDFFKSWSAGMAWGLGLLFTDGCMHSDQITLASTDDDLLRKFQVLLGSDSALTPNNYKGKAVQVLSLGHKELRHDLMQLGMIRRKSLSMEFPDVPVQFIRHFIRGCWDGDGGFTETGGKLYGHYTCGSATFIKRISDELFKVGVCRTNLRKNNSADDFFTMKAAYGLGPYPLTIYKRNQGRAFDLRIGTTSQLTPLFDFFYKDVDSSMYVSRKFQMIDRYLHTPWAKSVDGKNDSQ